MPIKVLFICHGNIFRLYEKPRNYAAYHMHIDTITHSVTQNLKPTPINKRSTRSCECIFSLTCKLLDGRRIHHIRFPERSAGCLSCSSIIYKQNISSIKCKVKPFSGLSALAEYLKPVVSLIRYILYNILDFTTHDITECFNCGGNRLTLIMKECFSELGKRFEPEGRHAYAYNQRIEANHVAHSQNKR